MHAFKVKHFHIVLLFALGLLFTTIYHYFMCRGSCYLLWDIYKRLPKTFDLKAVLPYTDQLDVSPSPTGNEMYEIKAEIKDSAIILTFHILKTRE